MNIAIGVVIIVVGGGLLALSRFFGNRGKIGATYACILLTALALFIGISFFPEDEGIGVIVVVDAVVLISWPLDLLARHRRQAKAKKARLNAV